MSPAGRHGQGPLRAKRDLAAASVFVASDVLAGPESIPPPEMARLAACGRGRGRDEAARRLVELLDATLRPWASYDPRADRDRGDVAVDLVDLAVLNRSDFFVGSGATSTWAPLVLSRRDPDAPGAVPDGTTRFPGLAFDATRGEAVTCFDLAKGEPDGELDDVVRDIAALARLDVATARRLCTDSDSESPSEEGPSQPPELRVLARPGPAGLQAARRAERWLSGV